MSCPYSALFGKPGEGPHSARFLGIAVFDTVATIILAVVTAPFFKVSVLYCFIGWFIAGEILHYVLGTKTAFLEMIGMTPNC